MTDEEIKIAVAEVLGLKVTSQGMVDNPYDESVKGFQPAYKPCPDYPCDLDAMSGAEAYFDDKPADVRSLWLDNLAVAAKWPQTQTALELKFEVSYLAQRLTARQRAEAFLRTLGKWKEDKP